jgi:RHS repeat-associated protein
MPSSITAPDGTYTISYEPTSGGYTGRIAKVVYPSGASVAYTYTGGNSGLTCERQIANGPNSAIMVPILTRTLTDATGVQRKWKYDTTQAANETVVTDPALNDTVYLFYTYTGGYGAIKGIYETQRQIYQGSHTSGTLLKTVLTCYNGNTNTTTCANPSTLGSNVISQKDVYTTLAGMMQSSQSETKYTGSGDLTEDAEYDFSGTLLSDRMITYGTYANGSCTSIGNYIGRVCTDLTKVGTTVYSQTNNTYDPHGNRTQTSSLVSGTNNYVTSSATYNTNGTVQFSYDTNQNKTTYTYGDCNGTMPTLVQAPLNLSRSMAWNCTGGVPLTSTDENSQSTQYKYVSQSGVVDPFWRPVEVDNPDGGQATATYNDSTSPPNIVRNQLIDSSLTLTTQTNFDGFGHATQTALTSDPQGTTYSVKVYDPLERLGTAYNPTRCNPPTTNCSENTWGYASYSYDALGRTTKITQPDGSQVATTYSGNCATVTDEAGKARQSCTDALGRVTGVWEDPGPTPHLNYETDYVYDALGNLLKVTQKGGASSGSWRTRTFVYDSLSRLTSATNPESGTVSYSYALSSGGLCAGAPKAVCTKTAPSPNQPSTGTATVSTTYTYDALNRLTGKSYNDAYTQNPVTPAVTYAYDGANISTCPTAIGYGGGSGNHSLGRRTAMCFGGGSKSWTFDPMGRVDGENDRFIWLVPPYSADVFTINSVPTLSEDTAYSYYLNGDLFDVYYPGPKGPPDYEFTTSENAAGQVTTAADVYFNVLNDATYAPTGQLATAVIGIGGGYNGTNISNTYNNRLQPVLESASTYSGTPILNLTYNFNLGNGTSGSDNGNVIQIANGKDSNRTQNFLYDSLNRIQQAYTSGPNWGETYSPNATAPGVAPSIPGIDAWGNLTNRSGVTGKTSTEPLSCSANTSNRLNTCYTYDAAGNLIQNGTTSYIYDSENRMIATSGFSYVYDGDGQRVEKCTQGTTPGTCASNAAGTFYWLHTGGGTLAESDLGGNWTAVYGLIRGQIVSRVDLPATVVHYYFNDHLNTTDIVTDAVGNILKESDYYPYGGEIPVIGSDPNRYKFTGKERDTESGLDYFGARHYASTMGRWMVPDKPFDDQAPSDPQSWNLYSYVRNNPLRFTDPNGGACVQGSDGSYHDDNNGGESCAQVDVNNATTGPSVTVSATTDDVSYQLANNIANLTSTSSLSEVGVNGMLWAGSARAAWDLGALGLSWAMGRASGEMIQGLYGPVSRATLEAAASGGGSTVRVVCTLDAAPAAGKALSTATGAGADALANAAGGGAKYVANIPSALVQTMENAGLVTRSTTSMGGAVATELKFAPQATQFVVQFFHAVQ